MFKLLVIADDFTGALDTGVQFAALGASTVVTLEKSFSENNCDVLVIDAETRHLAPEKAYETVANIVKNAANAGVGSIYKKTDSALRGNIGAELTACVENTEYKRLHFIPAYPLMNRCTRNGVHYIDGLPAAQSAFGRDPFEPVTSSDVRELIKAQSDIATRVLEAGDKADFEGIAVYNAATDEQLRLIGRTLRESGELGLTAGCAGFAAMLPELLGLCGCAPMTPAMPAKLIIICGSVNPITVSQLDYAEKHGVARIRLSERQKQTKDHFITNEGRAELESWTKLCLESKSCIFDANGDTDCQLDADNGMKKVSAALGEVFFRLVESGIDGTFFITGGDTLLACMKRMGCEGFYPICELAPGTVLSKMQSESDDRTLLVISKSGGFGGAELLTELIEKVTEKKER